MYVLAPITCYSKYDFTKVDEYPWEENSLIDVLSGEELHVEFEEKQMSVSDVYKCHNLVPTQLILLSEIGSMSNFLITTPYMFWKLVGDIQQQKDLLAKHPKLGAVLLPGLAMAPVPESADIMLSLQRMVNRMGLNPLPSLTEYDTINYKPLQFYTATKYGVTGTHVTMSPYSACHHVT